MSNFARKAMIGTVAAALFAGAAAAQLLPPLPLPPVSLPTGQLPVAGPLVEQVVGRQEAQQVISPTLDSVAGLPPRIVNAGQATLLDLRRLRLQQLVRDNRSALEAVEG